MKRSVRAEDLREKVAKRGKDLVPTIGGVQPMVEALAARSYWARREQARRALSVTRTVGDRETMGCSAVMYRRELILKHRFNLFFVGAGEDIDFSRRLKAAGWRLHRTGAIAYHRSRDTFPEFIKQRFWYGRGAVRLATQSAGRSQSEHGPRADPLAHHKPISLSHRRLDMLPFFLISGTAYHLGRAVEWAAHVGNGEKG
jgi:GT2 family glycosyltransferase